MNPDTERYIACREALKRAEADRDEAVRLLREIGQITDAGEEFSDARAQDVSKRCIAFLSRIAAEEEK